MSVPESLLKLCVYACMHVQKAFVRKSVYLRSSRCYSGFVCMYVCMCVSVFKMTQMYIYIYIYAYTHTYIYTQTYPGHFVWESCLSISISSVCMCLYTYICIYIYIHIYAHTQMHACIHIYMRIHTFATSFRSRALVWSPSSLQLYMYVCMYVSMHIHACVTWNKSSFHVRMCINQDFMYVCV